MKVIVKVDDSVSKEEVQSWIDEVLLETPCVMSAHIACEGCTCGAVMNGTELKNEKD